MEASALQLVLHAGFFVKCILFLLTVFSVVSWGIILYKYFYLRAAFQESAALLTVLRAGGDLNAALKTAATLHLSPLANLVKAATSPSRQESRRDVAKALQRQEVLETERLQAHLTFLATTGSTAPFIGLLGTVWGIMDAFRGIGATGSASLAVVAPAIAEALITTAAGLGAAIPAVIAYNAYVNWTHKLLEELEDFSAELRERAT